MGAILILGDIGRTEARFEWDKKDQKQIEAAERLFNELKGKGFAAFKMDKVGEPDENIFDFDPELECIVFLPQITGG